MSVEQRLEIEKKIQEDKAKLNSLLSEQKAALAREREEKYGSVGHQQAFVKEHKSPMP